jgi:orotate phosphoribosyltransferase
MVIRRGFEINPGEKVLIVEDVITTGGSVKEVVKIVEKAKGNIIGIGVLVDRSNGTAKIHSKQYSIINLNAESFSEVNVPSDLAKIPIQKPGSKYSK